VPCTRSSGGGPRSPWHESASAFPRGDGLGDGRRGRVSLTKAVRPVRRDYVIRVRRALADDLPREVLGWVGAQACPARAGGGFRGEMAVERRWPCPGRRWLLDLGSRVSALDQPSADKAPPRLPLEDRRGAGGLAWVTHLAPRSRSSSATKRLGLDDLPLRNRGGEFGATSNVKPGRLGDGLPGLLVEAEGWARIRRPAASNGAAGTARRLVYAFTKPSEEMSGKCLNWHGSDCRRTAGSTRLRRIFVRRHSHSREGDGPCSRFRRPRAVLRIGLTR
jgi:hypothetical protein